MIPVLLATFSLFTIAFNLVTIVYILRKKVAPYYFKVKLSLALNIIWCAAFGWFVVKSNNPKDLVFLLILLLFTAWYVLILLLNRLSKKSS